MAALSALPFGITGVFDETLFVGRQYSVEFLEPPQGAPVRLSFHFSAAHRFKFAPAAVLRTCPCALRHFAQACAARALHFPYVAIALR